MRKGRKLFSGWLGKKAVIRPSIPMPIAAEK
jgi:hypothetical protein